ncbi:unnamed protein product [Notodromas monacha]|uniref:Solute carrier family 13 member 2 n=1 Tax=Notodromas monacha TaxID=399045 RepID=A0A7R9BM34_9CRUS|nr:unnamed protein product [Notodromas monacha]CAG0918014.1 unnamed protein product [Notodromas monacha]
MADKFKDIARFTKASLVPHWRMFVIILAPLLPIGLLSDHYDEPAARCAWGVIIMSVYWMTEAVPLVITGMLPVLLFPVLGLIDTDTVSKLYLTKSNMLRMTGLMVAVAIENVGLHKRIALRILLLTGTSPRRIMLGFMLATVLISMWISNAAASAMMVPIVQAVLEEIYEKHVEVS